MVRLEILFVRHGLSCANAWGHRSKLLELLYPDPELTRYGIRRSIEKGASLKTFADRFFPDGRYAIGASCMIRAQQTAYHMLAHRAKKPIHVLPHIGERMPAICNVPLAPEQQRPILGAEVAAALGADARGDVGYTARADWDQFLTWAHALPVDSPFFSRAINVRGEPVMRAVLVTHSLYLQHVFHEMLNNNDVLYAKIDTATKTILEQRRLTDFNDLTDEKTEVEGCRFPTAASLTQQAASTLARDAGSLVMSGVGAVEGRLRGWLGGRSRRAHPTRRRHR
jgi:hypothetical protein